MQLQRDHMAIFLYVLLDHQISMLITKTLYGHETLLLYQKIKSSNCGVSFHRDHDNKEDQSMCVIQKHLLVLSAGTLSFQTNIFFYLARASILFVIFSFVLVFIKENISLSKKKIKSVLNYFCISCISK